jgi:hypothetical protein
MRSWFIELLQRNRGEGPKPSGICLWQDVKGMQSLVLELVERTFEQSDDWQGLGQKLARLRDGQGNSNR